MCAFNSTLQASLSHLVALKICLFFALSNAVHGSTYIHNTHPIWVVITDCSNQSLAGIFLSRSKRNQRTIKCGNPTASEHKKETKTEQKKYTEDFIKHIHDVTFVFFYVFHFPVVFSSKSTGLFSPCIGFLAIFFAFNISHWIFAQPWIPLLLSLLSLLPSYTVF